MLNKETKKPPKKTQKRTNEKPSEKKPNTKKKPTTNIGNKPNYKKVTKNNARIHNDELSNSNRETKILVSENFGIAKAKKRLKTSKVIFLNRRSSSNNKENHNLYWFLNDKKDVSDIKFLTNNSAFQHIKDNYVKTNVHIHDAYGDFTYRLSIKEGKLTSIKGSKRAFSIDKDLEDVLLQIFGKVQKNKKVIKKDEIIENKVDKKTKETEKFIKKNKDVVIFSPNKNISASISSKKSEVIFLNRRLSLKNKKDHNFYWFLIDDNNKSDIRYVTKLNAFKHIKNNYVKVKVYVQDNGGNFAYKLSINEGNLISIKGSKRAFSRDENLKTELLLVFGEYGKNKKKINKVEQVDVVGNDIIEAQSKDEYTNKLIKEKNNEKITIHKTKIKEKKINKNKEAKTPKKDKEISKVINKHKITSSIIRGSTSKTTPLLKISKVTKQFGSFKALDEVSFQIKRGERIGLIGGNGAGKTTLTEIIAGINKPTSGTITYGFNFEDTPKENIGMQFQQSTYPSGLTVKDIIKFAINLRKLTLAPSELLELMKVFQMEEFYSRKVRSLSGGQRQKLNILLSILHNPKLIILDELSTGLDISAREEIINFADKLLKDMGMSAIVISHHMGEISALCSRVVVLDRGKVVGIKPISEIIIKHGSLEEYAKKIIRRSNEKARRHAAKNRDTSEIELLDIKQKKTKLTKKVDKLSVKNEKLIAKNNDKTAEIKSIEIKNKKGGK